ncbi:MAG: aldehyde dehydrogenase [Actinobacteria bacterium]|nr:aldehyde dehydrogenase [Actinomycetota bacterium]
MTLKTDLYIDGKWVKGSGTVPVYDPSDASVIAEIQTAGAKECDAAVDAAFRAFPDWAKTAPRYRAEILRKAFEIMVAEADQLAELVSRENGKVVTDADGLVLYKSMRSSSSTEGYHKNMWPGHRGFTASPQKSCAIHAERRHRHNHNSSEKNTYGFPKLGHYDTFQIDKLQHLYREFGINYLPYCYACTGIRTREWRRITQ